MINTVNDIFYKFKQSIFVILLSLCTVYFAMSIINGDRGIFKYMYLQDKVKAAQADRQKQLLVKKQLEHKVSMLSSQSLDLDYLEERARIVLNMVGKNEYVILDKDINKI